MNPRIWLIASIISGLLSVFFFFSSIIEKRRAGPFGMVPASEQVVDTGNYAVNAPVYGDDGSYPENSSSLDNLNSNTEPAANEAAQPAVEEGFPSNLPSYDSVSPDLWVRISGDMRTCWLVVPANRPKGVRAIAPDGRRFEIVPGERISLDVQGGVRYKSGGNLVGEQGETRAFYGGLGFKIGTGEEFLTADNRSFTARFSGLPRFRVIDYGDEAYRDNVGYYTVIIRKGG